MKTTFEIRQLDAWNSPEGWMVNTSYHLGEMKTAAENVNRAFYAWMKRHGIIFYRGRTRAEYDGDAYTITDRKTGEPLFIAIPNNF